jgi:hypothetical protein
MDIPIKPPIPPLPNKAMCDHDKVFESWDDPGITQEMIEYQKKKNPNAYRYATFRCKKCRQTFRGVPVKL